MNGWMDKMMQVITSQNKTVTFSKSSNADFWGFAVEKLSNLNEKFRFLDIQCTFKSI